MSAIGEDLFLYIELWVFFPSLVNTGWDEFFKRGKHKGERKAKTRYKRIDASNRTKLLEDAVAEALGLDDSRFQTRAVKAMDPEHPRVEVRLWVDDPTEYGVPSSYVDLHGSVPSARDIPGGG